MLNPGLPVLRRRDPRAPALGTGQREWGACFQEPQRQHSQLRPFRDKPQTVWKTHFSQRSVCGPWRSGGQGRRAAGTVCATQARLQKELPWWREGLHGRSLLPE